jgi:predicted ABC-class ATPase
MGGSGDYFEAADTVIAMEEYRPRVVTGHAREIALARRDLRRLEGVAGFGLLRGRVPLAEGLKPRRGRREKVGAKGLNSIVFGRQTIDLSAVEQVVDPSQTRAIAEMMRYGLHRGYFDGCNTLSQVLDLLEGDIAAEGIDIIASDRETAAAPGEHPGDLALPRRYEVAAALNRIRTGKFL